MTLFAASFARTLSFPVAIRQGARVVVVSGLGAGALVACADGGPDLAHDTGEPVDAGATGGSHQSGDVDKSSGSSAASGGVSAGGTTTGGETGVGGSPDPEEPGSGGSPGTGGSGEESPQLTLLDTAVELGRSKITDHSYSARGVGADSLYAGAMGGRSVTYRGYQYILYYEGNGKVTTARRDLAFTPVKWESSTLNGYTVTTDDRHNKMTLAISKGDGTMHMAFDHHTAGELHYARTLPGVANNPKEQVWNNSVFTYTENFGKDSWFSGTFAERTVTYPTFLGVGDDIMLYWRSGGAAQGRMNLANYDNAKHDWITRRTFTSEVGTYREGSWSSSKRGPYNAGVILDAQGNLHVAWIWREAGCNQVGVRYCNHGLYYAYTPDLGRTWLSTDGETLAGDGDTITVADINPVWDIGIELDPSNPSLQSRFVEETGEFEVYVDHKDAIGGNARSTYRYTRAVDGTWSKEKTKRTPGGLGVAIPAGGPGSVPNQSWDYARLESEGIASVVFQEEPSVRGTSTPLYVIDYRFAQ